MHPPVLETERLRLTPFCESDVDALFGYASNSAVARWMAWEPHRSREESAEVIRYFMTRGPGEFEWALRLRENGLLVGGLSLLAKQAEAEIHFSITEAYWNRGLASEAARAAIAWAWANRPELQRIRTAPAAENVASCRVLGKLGFREGGRRQAGFHKFPGGVEVVDYELRRTLGS
jgi:ribosomal-protein-alanine N-acetyltransferase